MLLEACRRRAGRDDLLRVGASRRRRWGDEDLAPNHAYLGGYAAGVGRRRTARARPAQLRRVGPDDHRAEPRTRASNSVPVIPGIPWLAMTMLTRRRSSRSLANRLSGSSPDRAQMTW